jgi:hypothetical protein
MEQEAFHLGAKSLRRLQVAAKCVHFIWLLAGISLHRLCNGARC